MIQRFFLKDLELYGKKWLLGIRPEHTLILATYIYLFNKVHTTSKSGPCIPRILNAHVMRSLPWQPLKIRPSSTSVQRKVLSRFPVEHAIAYGFKVLERSPATGEVVSSITFMHSLLVLYSKNVLARIYFFLFQRFSNLYAVTSEHNCLIWV